MRTLRTSLYEHIVRGSSWQGNMYFPEVRPLELIVMNTGGPIDAICGPEERSRNDSQRKRTVLFESKKMKEVKLEFLNDFELRKS